MTLADLLDKWLGREGGAERANYQMFLTELCQALGLPSPDPKGAGLGGYQFEAPVKSAAALGRKGTGRIDLYRRDAFILEAKQSQLREGETAPAEPAAPPPEPVRNLFGDITGYAAPEGKAAPRYDRLMADARLQAERYALALPDDHRTPPFLIVADIGRSFELYFDWAGNGRGYGPFPDERHYRVALADLASKEPIAGLDLTPADLLRAIWLDPKSVDPRLKAAKVTRDIAERLSRVAAQLEKVQRELHPGREDIALGIEQTSLFLMRMLFCMFAEDVELLPKGSFQRFLETAKDRSALYWQTGLRELWSKMNDRQELNRFWSEGDAIVRYFNGNLFANVQIYDLPAEFKGELLVAASKDWRAVEPAIFGTLLEQVLTPADRAKLGAHYTPRAYVERLVQATIMDVLSAEWEAVLAAARASADAGDTAAAIHAACAFHARLVAVRVLDPACGTGNFLYVAMEQLLRLESEVRQFVVGLGGTLDPQVHPNQFLGLELNPRAAVIAELVLWIGWLRYRLANTPEAIGEPVLPPLTNINGGTHGGFDAVLVRDATGEPDTANPRRPAWPEAEFIVGNPPFIGGKGTGIRATLGSDYSEALWKANPNLPKSADFVMHWWDRAATILTAPGTKLRRFGFVTTNSITQVFSRRVIERYLAESWPPAAATPSPAGADAPVASPASGRGGAPSKSPALPSPLPPAGEATQAQPERVRVSASAASATAKLSLILAIPDHPWTRATRDAAAVRIAMTVAEAGAHDGAVLTVVREAALDTDEPVVETETTPGRINANLTIGPDTTAVIPLLANAGLSCNGMMLAGQGFKITEAQADEIVRDDGPNASQILRRFVGGSDLLKRQRTSIVIDFFGLAESEARKRFPVAYSTLLKSVKPDRDTNADKSMRENWWRFGRVRHDLRSANAKLNRYIVTTETSKHRVFDFIDTAVLPDHMVIAIGSDSAAILGVLSSRVHTDWTLETGGWLGYGNDNRYNKSIVLDPFPFPAWTAKQQKAIAAIAEELAETRSAALADDPRLTMTGLYNLVEAVRSGAPLTPAQEAAAVKARARIVAKLHDDLDLAVADAYGWGEDWRRAPLPPAEIVAASSPSTPNAPPRKPPAKSAGSAPTTRSAASPSRNPPPRIDSNACSCYVPSTPHSVAAR